MVMDNSGLENESEDVSWKRLSTNIRDFFHSMVHSVKYTEQRKGTQLNGPVFIL